MDRSSVQTVVANSQVGSHRRKRARHMAEAKRLELLESQPAGPACCDSCRPCTHASILCEEW
jgi:hypothetical protein